MAPVIPFILAALKSKTVQGLLVTAASYVAQKHGVDPGTVMELATDIGMAGGVAWTGVGFRDAISPLSLKLALPVPIPPVKKRKPRGPNKPKTVAGASAVDGAVAAGNSASVGRKPRSTREIVKDLEGGNSAAETQGAQANA